jgi:hypothetical protein
MMVSSIFWPALQQELTTNSTSFNLVKVVNKDIFTPQKSDQKKYFHAGLVSQPVAQPLPHTGTQERRLGFGRGICTTVAGKPLIWPAKAHLVKYASVPDSTPTNGGLTWSSFVSSLFRYATPVCFICFRSLLDIRTDFVDAFAQWQFAHIIISSNTAGFVGGFNRRRETCL